MKNKIGIFGGTFDPPHIGHINIAISVYENLNLKKIIFIPTKNPYYKIIPKNTATCYQRLMMLKIATKNFHFTEINDIEIKNKSLNYTFNTINNLKKNFYYQQNTKFYFIIGTDMFLDIFNWYRARELFKCVSFVVIPRKKNDILLLNKKNIYSKIKFQLLKNINYYNISSTSLRNNIQKKYLQKEIYDFIINNRIYFKSSK